MEPEDVLRVFGEREKAARERERQRERKAVISGLILLFGLACGCALAYIAAKGVH